LKEKKSLKGEMTRRVTFPRADMPWLYHTGIFPAVRCN
jgi:hypothetical protein